MKTKFILLFVWALLCSTFTFAQETRFTCEHKESATVSKKASKPTKPVTATTPCDDDAITFLKVNVHYILKYSSETSGAGNFTEVDDGGLGLTDHTGYSWAAKLVKRLNDYMKRNVQVALWPGSDDIPPTLPPDIDVSQIQVVHKGTYFHRVSDEEYYALSNPSIPDVNILNNYGINLGSEINIFLMEKNSTSYTGGTAYTNQASLGTIMYNGWRRYQFGQGDATTQMSRVAFHEIGHMLGLGHTWCGGNGCDDIDVVQENCGNSCTVCWNSGGNNVMSSVDPNIALSPCQIDEALQGLMGLDNYVEQCCTDWDSVPGICTSCSPDIPSMRMEMNCDQPKPCSDFQLLSNLEDFGASGGCKFTYWLTGDDAAENCNNWTVTVRQPGNVVSTMTFTNTLFIEVPVASSSHIKVCVTICGDDCTDLTTCAEGSCFHPFAGDDDHESTTTPGGDNAEIILQEETENLAGADCPLPDFGAVNLGNCCVQLVFPNDVPAECNVTWDFGDNSDNTAPNANGQYCFAQNGTYTISLTIDGKTAFRTVKISNCSTNPPCPDPFFTYVYTSPCCVLFQLKGEVPAECNVTWDFGDNSGATAPDRDGTHCFDADGIYTVTYTIDGVSYTQQVTIFGCNQNDCPEPGFNYCVDDCCVTFELDNPAPANCKVGWDFGDGSGDTQPDANGQHCFDSPGLYIVTQTTDGVSVEVPIYVTGCDSLPCTNDFEIVTTQCFEKVTGQIPTICFELQNFQQPSDCNIWEVRFINIQTGILVQTTTYDNVDFVLQFFPPGNPDQYYIEVCVKLCDEGCEAEQCETFYPPFFLANNEGGDRGAKVNDQFQMEEHKLMVAPNPSNGSFTVHLAESIARGDLMIFDVKGKLIWETTLVNEAQKNIELEGLAKGIYMIRLQSENKVQFEKIVIQ